MATARGLRLRDDLEEEIRREAEALGRSWSALVNEMLGEALRMRRVPGIVFTNGPGGRRASLAGTGLDVWEVVATWKAEGEDPQALALCYPTLSEPQLRSALAYYQLYPAEIEARLERERSWTPERLAREMPFLTPGLAPARKG